MPGRCQHRERGLARHCVRHSRVAAVPTRRAFPRSCKMQKPGGTLRATRLPCGGVTVWRHPTRADRAAYLLPALFCLLAVGLGIFLTAALGGRFAALAAVALAFGLLFILLSLRRRAVSVVLAPAGELRLPRAFRDKRVPAAAVVGVEAMHGADEEAGVSVKLTPDGHPDGFPNVEAEVVLVGLSEKDRARAAAILKHALAGAGCSACSGAECPPLVEGLPIPGCV